LARPAILDHEVTCSASDIREEKIGPSSTFCVAKAEISAMYGKNVWDRIVLCLVREPYFRF